ncbi:MAG: hypothetical protein QG626_678 [Patescibacteria group bacterium]|nr:hypothetical protein [Patescibacteria group bacterium]
MHIAPRATQAPATVYFLDWIKTYVESKPVQARAERVFVHLVRSASPLGRLTNTPQTPPFHAEAEFVSGHVIRILAVLDALEHGASLAVIEECAREKEFLLEFFELEAVIRSQMSFLSAYAACHDVGKADTLVFTAPTGSRGQAEGFQGEAVRLATESEKTKFDKLRRAHALASPTGNFFESFQISAHYPEHAKRAAADEYASTRQAVLDVLGIPHSHAKLLAELIRCHADVIDACAHGVDAHKYRAWAAIADKAGLNVPFFLDLLPATLFLDAVLGSLSYKSGAPAIDVSLVLNIFKAEREAMPERHLAREQAFKRGRKQAVQDTLKQANIDAESVFALLKTPLGPVRGEVMRNVYHLIQSPDMKVDFGDATVELRRRARVAQTLLADQNLTLE